MNNQQLVVRLATLGRPQLLSSLLDVVVPLGLKNGDVLYYSSNTSNFTLGSLSFVDGANTIIRLRRSSVANTNSLSDGELYYSFTDRKLYIGNSTNHLVAVAGEYYVDLLNSTFVIGNAAYTQANTARVHANAAHASANASLIHSNAAFDQANTARTLANGSYEQANTARDLANTKFSSSGGVITGDVSIVGSLILSGNTSFINVSTYSVSDPLLYLASNNYSSDIVDIGFVANYVNSTGQNVHTGLYREHTTKEYYIFQEYNKEPDNNHINPNANGFTLSVLNADLRTSNLILAGTNAVAWIRNSYDQANTSRVHANAAHVTANASFVQANTARDHANASHATVNASFSQANTARIHANAAYATVNSAFNQANTARDHANSSFSRANLVYDVANTKLNLSGGTIAGDLVVSGNITVSGQTTYANTIRLLIGDNILTLNADLPAAFAPSENAGLEINRGISANTYLIWNEGTDNWTFTTDGTTYYNIPTNTAVEIATAIGQAAFVQANTTRDHANTAHVTANAGFVQANTARDHANVAFAKANAALSNVSGSVFNGNLIVSGNLNAQFARLADGSNLSPSISFANSINTGIYRTSSNQIGFSVSGEDILLVSSSGINDNVVFEIVDANNEALFSVSANTQGNILEVYDTFTTNTLLFSVEPNQIYSRNQINVNSDLIITSNTRISPANLQFELTRFSANTFSGGKFIILGKQGSNTHISELSVVHDGTTAYFTEYGMVFSNTSLFTAMANLSSSNVIVSVLPAVNGITTFTIVENRLIV